MEEDELARGPGFDPIADEYKTCVARCAAAACMAPTSRPCSTQHWLASKGQRGQPAHHNVLPACAAASRYEDYLDNQITATDMFYLEDVELARQLVELGCAGEGGHARMRACTPATACHAARSTLPPP